MDSTQWVITDCGSTTSKTIVFSKENNRWKMKDWAVSPTTVEAPHADVNVGVKNTFDILKKRSSLSESIFTSSFPSQFLATSSAGGGLRIAIVGLTKEISVDFLSRAALHSGAIISGVVSLDDELDDDARIAMLQSATPDIVLLSAGVKNALPQAFAELVILLKEASLRSRLSNEIKIPVIFSGSKLLLPELALINDEYEITAVEEIAQTVDATTPIPTEKKIHDLFLTSVMEHAPGYKALLAKAVQPIIPTPLAVSDALSLIVKEKNESILCIDIGGATTDIFSSSENGIERSVSSNIGMSYSSYYVFQAAGVNAFRKYLSDQISDIQIEESIFNKMLRPTTLPVSEDEQQIEFALCRVGIELAYKAHVEIIAKEKKSRGVKSLVSVFRQNESLKKYTYDRVIASGGVFSHCPDPNEISWILADALPLSGIVEIVVDSIFMLPHLGVLSHVNPEASKELLFSECLVTIGILIVLDSISTLNVNGEAVRILKKRNQMFEFPTGIKYIQLKGVTRQFSNQPTKLFVRLRGQR